MSAIIETGSLRSADNNTSLHMMPCHISHNSSASVEKYFQSSIRTSKDEQNGNESSDKPNLTAAFRGRPLVGCNIEVPSGYTGLVLKENRRPFSEDEERDLKIVSKFNNFTFWNLDKNPSADDKLQQALEWCEISEIVHSTDTSSKD